MTGHPLGKEFHTLHQLLHPYLQKISNINCIQGLTCYVCKINKKNTECVVNEFNTSNITCICLGLMAISLVIPLNLHCTRAVPKCRIIVAKVSQTERYSIEILHA